jgi:hypothetical protein
MEPPPADMSTVCQCHNTVLYSTRKVLCAPPHEHILNHEQQLKQDCLMLVQLFVVRNMGMP